MKTLNPLKLTLLGSLIAVSFVACKTTSPSDEGSDVSSSNDQGIWESLKHVPTAKADDISRPNFVAKSKKVFSMVNFDKDSTVNAMQMLRTALMEPLTAGKITYASFLEADAGLDNDAADGKKEIVMKNGGMPLFGFGPYTDYFYAESFPDDSEDSEDVQVSGVIVRTPGEEEPLFDKEDRKPSFDNFLVTVYTITPEILGNKAVKFTITAETRASSTSRTLRTLGKGPAQKEMKNALITQLQHAVSELEIGFSQKAQLLD